MTRSNRENQERNMRRGLKPYIRSAYDFQEERKRAYNRGLEKSGEAPVSYLTQEDRDRFTRWGQTFEGFEKEAFDKIEETLDFFGVWRDFLSDVKGIGPAMGGVLLASFDPHKARHPSNYWAYAGLADGREAVCQKCGHVTIITGDPERTCCWKGKSIKKNGCGGKLVLTGKRGHQRKIAGEPLRFNAWLRTKMFVLASVFMRLEGKCEYRHYYDEYKARLKNEGRTFTDKNGKQTPWNDGHYDMAAKRYMVKMFLLDFWRWDRAEAGLPLGESYQEARLGHRHGQDNNGLREAV